MFDLSGKKAFICGGAGYLGFPVSMKIAEAGADVAIADFNNEAADEAVSEVAEKFPAGKVISLKMDVSSEESIKDSVRKASEEMGGIDIMVNLAAAGTNALVDEITPGDLAETLNINIAGSLMLSRECAEKMTGGGSIILYSSMYGRVAPDPRIYEPPMKPNPVDYGAAKAGIEQLVRYLAVSWAGRNIRVNGICPGPFPNAGKPSYSEDAGFASFVQRLVSRVPLGRVGRPDETAGAAVFLASDEASFITGHTIVIDGGWTAW